MRPTSPATSRAPEAVRAAYVRRPHGVRGELRVEPLGGDASRFTLGLVLRREDGGDEYAVRAARELPGGDVLLLLDTVASRAEADRLRGAYLCVDRARLRALPDGEWFGFELIGLRAVTAAGEELGEVVDVEHHPGNDVLVVCLRDGGVLRLPFVRAFVPHVDVAAGVVSVTPWEEDPEPVGAATPSAPAPASASPTDAGPRAR